MTFRFVDAAPIAGTRVTQDGYLIADCIVARDGVQVYGGAEMGSPRMVSVRVWRPADEVSAVASVRTYSHAPVTMGHPEEPVTKDNWADLAKGEVGEEAKWEDGKLRLPLIVKDAGAIQAINDGVRELSAGYTCDVEWESGTTPDGQTYDAIQKNIKINHVAIVPRGRAGVARFGDARPWGASPINETALEATMADIKLTTVVAFDEAYDLNDAGQRLAKRYADALKAAQDEASDLQKQLDTQIAAKDAEISTLTEAKDAAEQKAKDATMSPADINALIASRKATMDKAVALGLDAKKVEELSEEDMKAEAVKKKMGDKADKYTADQFAAAFDVLEATKHPLKEGIKDQKRADDADEAYSNYVATLGDAWKTTSKKEAA